MYDKQYYKGWYEKNKEKQKIWQQEYYRKNKEHILEMHKAWAKKNVDHTGSVWRLYGRRRRNKNPNIDKEYRLRKKARLMPKPLPDSPKVEYKYFHWGPYLFRTRITQEECNLLIKEGKKYRKKSNDHRSRLAGHLKEEYKFTDLSLVMPWFKKYIIAYLESHWDYCRVDASGRKHPPNFSLNILWINYMKANEFNPPHFHDGDLSFIIYPDVPQQIKQENQNFKGKGLGPGGVTWEYGERHPHYISAIPHTPVTRDLFIFPSTLMHWVYPFRSNVERISLSGNITLMNEGIG